MFGKMIRGQKINVQNNVISSDFQVGREGQLSPARLSVFSLTIPIPVSLARGAAGCTVQRVLERGQGPELRETLLG